MKRAIVFGLGKTFQSFFLAYNRNEIQIIAYSDNNENIVGQSVHSIPVIAPKDICSMGFDTIIITCFDYENIKKQLQSYGIHDDKINHYITYRQNEDQKAGELAYERMLGMSESRPLDLNVETISFCPMKCLFCCNRLYKRDMVVMANSLFEKIVSEYIELWEGGTIGIGSMQSDFLSDPMLLNRLSIINKYKENLYVYSTTPLISLAKYTDDEVTYILSNFHYLQISVAGYDEGSYRLMGGIDGFREFRRQLLRVKQIIDKNKISIKIELLFRSYDFIKVIDSEFYLWCESMFTVTEIMTDYFSWFGSINEHDLPLGAKIRISDNNSKIRDCVVPAATLAVQASGKVVGCGCIDWLEKNVIGDCNKETLADIWHGKKHHRFKTGFSSGNLPCICRECGLYADITKCFANSKLINYESIQGPYYSI